MAIVDTVEWTMTNDHCVDFLHHYLDNLLMLGPPGSPVCLNNLGTCLQLSSDLGLPLHSHKLDRPSSTLTILGIELDSVALQTRLPVQK